MPRTGSAASRDRDVRAEDVLRGILRGAADAALRGDAELLDVATRGLDPPRGARDTVFAVHEPEIQLRVPDRELLERREVRVVVALDRHR